MTATATIAEARRVLGTLTDVPADVLSEVLTADRGLQVAGDLLIEARTVHRQDDTSHRIAATYR